MSERERTEAISLGVSVADATSPALHLEGQVLTIRFLDWREQSVCLMCHDVVAVRWQEADRFIDDNDRYDGTSVVWNSEWLADHAQQNILFGDREFRHLKLNFNAAGILEVLCTTTEISSTATA